MFPIFRKIPAELNGSNDLLLTGIKKKIILHEDISIYHCRFLPLIKIYYFTGPITDDDFCPNRKALAPYSFHKFLFKAMTLVMRSGLVMDKGDLLFNTNGG